jgi:hypothetical protein
MRTTAIVQYAVIVHRRPLVAGIAVIEFVDGRVMTSLPSTVTRTSHAFSCAVSSCRARPPSSRRRRRDRSTGRAGARPLACSLSLGLRRTAAKGRACTTRVPDLDQAPRESCGPAK